MAELTKAHSILNGEHQDPFKGLFSLVGGIPTPTFFTVDIAQLVEHRFVVPSVVGSIPIIHPKVFPLFDFKFLIN